MTRKRLYELLKYGRGEALLFLKNCPDREKYADIVKKAVTGKTGYDPQCEGSGAGYYTELIRIMGNRTYYAELLKCRLEGRISRDSSREIFKIIEILQNLYYDGCGDILPYLDSLYEKELHRLVRCRKTPPSNAFEYLCIVLSETDRSYYVKTAERVGEFLYTHPESENFDLSLYYSYFERSKKAARVTPQYLKAFCAAFDYAPQKKMHSSPQTTEERKKRVRELIFSGGGPVPFYLLRWYGENADLSEISEIYELLRQCLFREKDEERAGDILKIAEYAAACTDQTLLHRAAQTGGDRIKYGCLAVLIRHDKSGDYTHALLSAVKNDSIPEGWESAFEAFTDSTKDFDGIIRILESLPKKEYTDYVHSAVMSVTERNIRTPRAERLLYYLYDRNPCSLCRTYCLKTMSRCGVLSEKLLNICLYDVNEDTVRYARKRLNLSAK